MPDSSVSSLLTPAAVAALLRDQSATRLLDVRTAGEFAAAHIPGAYNVPLDALAEHSREIHSVTGAPVVLVCQSGQRARKADDSLRSLGMPNLYILDGGVNAWTAAGLEVTRGARRISLERQVRIAAGAMGASGAFLALFVNPLFAIVPAFVGSGLVFAAITDTCTMGMMLARLPYNRSASCDTEGVVRALLAGAITPGPSSNSANAPAARTPR